MIIDSESTEKSFIIISKIVILCFNEKNGCSRAESKTYYRAGQRRVLSEGLS